ncbi:uncharacterized protein LOC135958088 [Calliphora vicina]|uniref:uncharacterized protein LOC135958088 n=1 Tax=Calliphora vicina TaxID=7373 RepID=UPI00325AC802
MPRGTLGESESDVGEQSENNFSYQTRSSIINNPYNRATTSNASSVQRTTNKPSMSSSNTLRGAARRKMSGRRREMKQLRTIINLQKTTNLLIPRAPFARVVREISIACNPDIVRYTLTAMEALQEATEMFLVQLLQDSYLLTMHRKCVTLSKADLMLIRSLKLNF